MTFSPLQYRELTRAFKVRCRYEWVAPNPPVHFSEVRSTVDNDVLFYLEWKPGRDEWQICEDVPASVFA